MGTCVIFVEEQHKMKSTQIITLIFLYILSLISCKEEVGPDLIFHSANIYTVEEEQGNAQALAIKDGFILAIGDNKSVLSAKGSNTKIIDAKGQFLMPGFIEGHGHFTGMGNSLINLNLLNTKNWEEVLSMVKSKVGETKKGAWLKGRGWHQEKWDTPLQEHVHGYPYHDELSKLTADNPVILFHASGHSLFANEKAMNAVGISKETPDPIGGKIIRDNAGQAIGVFEERAMKPFREAFNSYEESISKEETYALWLKGINLAQELCLQQGVTSFQDAGSTFKELNDYKTLAEAGDLDIRLWAMIRESHEDIESNLSPYPIIGAGNNFFTCRAIKSEVDGALGSFGAWLLKPYHDKPGFEGQNTTSLKDVVKIAKLAKQKDLQMCVHSIGDRANRVVLDMFEAHMPKKGYAEGSRWRIEHAQHLNPADIGRFSELGVIASMQAVHCTSDAPFVEKRLGEKRSKEGAYAWRSLLDSGARIANGTDVPVEDISPLDCIYAAVTRKRKDNDLAFFTEQKMSRAEAIKSYTLDNAYAAFEENSKGSIKVGKLADIILLDKNLMTCSEKEILDAKVTMTVVGGEIKYVR